MPTINDAIELLNKAHYYTSDGDVAEALTMLKSIKRVTGKEIAKLDGVYPEYTQSFNKVADELNKRIWGGVIIS